MKNIQSKIKLIKTGKKLQERIVQGVKIDNVKSQEVKMTKKVLREKSNCVVCRSSISKFLKQKQKNKK